MQWEDLYAEIDSHAEEWGPLTATIRRVAQANQETQRAETKLEAAKAVQKAAELEERRLTETAMAIGLLEPAWVAALPQLPDLVRTALAAVKNFNDANDLPIDFQPAPGLGPLRLYLVRTWNPRAYTQARLMYANISNDQWRRCPQDEPACDQYFNADTVETALYNALLVGHKLATWQARHTAWLADEEYRLAAVEADRQRQAALDRALSLDEQAGGAEPAIETERLLAWVKSDPAVTNLVRAFIAIEEQRASLAERLDAADEAASNAWNHCEQTSAELRRQAAEARREADRQRAEARRYEDEAEDARKKIKDAERRSESYYQRRSAWEY